MVGHVLKLLAKSVLIPLGLTVAASETDAAIHKKCMGLACRSLDLATGTTLIISTEKMNDIMKIIKSLEESTLLIKTLAKQLKKKQKNKKAGF